MLTAVKNQLKVNLLSVKYSLMREMLNKTTFLMNIIFMILNNASFIIQWIILFSLRDNIGGYQLKHVLLLWALTSTSYGFSHFFFKSAYKLSDTIRSFKAILSGDYDKLPESAFLYCGTIEDVVEKANGMK